MTLPEKSLRNRHVVYALFIGAVLFGLIAYFSLPVQLFPDTAPPLVNVLTPYPGAAAEDVADLVSEPIETEAASLEGVASVSSKSQNGLSLVEVEFRYGVSADLAAVDVQNAISRIRSSLPREIGEPQVLKFSTGNKPVLTMGLRGGDFPEVRRLAEDVIAPEIQRLSGVAIVDVFGGYRPEITVAVDRYRLEAHRLPLSAVTDAIRSHNISEPAGEIKGEGRHVSFRVESRGDSIEDLAGIFIATPAGYRVRAGDIAEIRQGSGEDLSRFRVNGKPAIAVQIFKQDDANTVEVVQTARGKIEELKTRYPDVEMEIASEDATFASLVVENMLGAVRDAILLAGAIIFLFLGSLRRGIVVLVTMPMSFLLTFAGMKLFGLQLDMVTLTAIILAVGMVVDASVVILENISRRHAEDGLPPFEAALEGANEIQFSVIAGNATTLVVLVPLLFLYGFIGKTFGPLAATLIIAFLSSLLVALALVPILTMFTLGGGSRLEKFAAFLSRPWERLMATIRLFYVSLLEKALRRRWIVIAAAVVSFAAGAVMLRNQGMEMLPKMDGGASFVTVETPSGTSLEATENVMAEVEEVIRREPELRLISSQIGYEPGMRSSGGGGVQGSTQGYTTITWSDRTDRKESVWEIQDRLRERLGRIPGIRNFVVKESGSTAKATTSASIIVRIKGGDPLVLDALGDMALEKLRAIDGAVNPRRSWYRDRKIIGFEIDDERAREIGISPKLIAREISQSVDGMAAGVFYDAKGVKTPILVRYGESYRFHEEDVYGVRIVSPVDGKTIPVGAVVKGREHITQGLVTRENLQGTLDILAAHQGRPLNFVTADVEKAIRKLPIPAGYTIETAGENRDMDESRSEIAGALVFSLIAIYLLLAAQFRSFLHPVTVLTSVPLSLFGIALALRIAGKPISMPVLVGLVLLVGIVVNSAIILIDFIVENRKAGVPRREAILKSVNVRFRPIMMTSLSTIVGMLPLSLEWALGAERFSPLATAVIGGMTASTFLTLIMVPVFYDLLEDAKEKARSLFRPAP